MLRGYATLEASQRFLDTQFSVWKYQPAWQKTLSHHRVSSSLLGVEFTTTDIPDIQTNFEQLLRLGCNHFQWALTQPEELAFVQASPVWDYLKPGSSPLVSRDGLFFSLRLPPLAISECQLVAEQAASKFRLEHWDRIIITPLETTPLEWAEGMREKKLKPPVKGEIGVNFSGEPYQQQILEALEPAGQLSHMQVPFNIVQFRNFLRRDWQLQGTRYALPKLLENWQCSVSFRSPFAIEYGQTTGNLLSDIVKESKNYQQELQTVLSLLMASETRLNQDLKKWTKEPPESINLEDFDFISLLKEACETIQTVEEWEQYLSTLWFPPFHHNVRSWSLKISEIYLVQWRWMIDGLMAHIHDLMGLQAEALRAKQAQRMLPFNHVFQQLFPEMPMALTFGAKTLLLLASTPWPETVLFPWKTLDNTVEYLGLMRFPLLNNSGLILKEFSKIKVT